MYRRRGTDMAMEQKDKLNDQLAFVIISDDFAFFFTYLTVYITYIVDIKLYLPTVNK